MAMSQMPVQNRFNWSTLNYQLIRDCGKIPELVAASAVVEELSKTLTLSDNLSPVRLASRLRHFVSKKHFKLAVLCDTLLQKMC